MSLEKLNAALVDEVRNLEQEGRAKTAERVIVGYEPPQGDFGPRYRLKGSGIGFIRMNSNSYLSLSHHPEVISEADKATHIFGVGPGAVRFIDGTFNYHVALERDIAEFVDKPAAKIFNSAYTANLGLALAIAGPRTYWVGDALNHNSIIRAMRIAGVPRENKAIYKHNDMDDLGRCLDHIPAGMDRVVVIFDGIFSMRGDNAPMTEIHRRCEPHRDRFSSGLVTVVDDSHGLGAYGATGRGTEDFCGTKADITVGTFGKAFGVNGGFVAASPELTETIRQKADTYIYTNPLSVADCAAASKALDIADSPAGAERLEHLRAMTGLFRQGISDLGWESIPGPHPIVPLLVRETEKTKKLVRHFYDHGVLVVGLAFPVVPKGDDTIRVQINAAHTEADIKTALGVLESFSS
ncbi:MAG: aminotransferase class I/II-fold pyridoxal phosphate-dependent enzyme [Thermoanaerobaculales bacterium]|nr:aminotransferase class I/II-fold pyridoxal phosphate-dependent enzyme [Thermoanaerobaculales bacterium]